MHHIGKYPYDSAFLYSGCLPATSVVDFNAVEEYQGSFHSTNVLCAICLSPEGRDTSFKWSLFFKADSIALPTFQVVGHLPALSAGRHIYVSPHTGIEPVSPSRRRCFTVRLLKHNLWEQTGFEPAFSFFRLSQT